jgi:hypothetical protein
MFRKGKPVMVGCFSALAVVAVALALKFGTGRLGTWFAPIESVAKDRERDVSEISKLLSGGPSQSYEESRNEALPHPDGLGKAPLLPMVGQRRRPSYRHRSRSHRRRDPGPYAACRLPTQHVFHRKRLSRDFHFQF